MRGWGGQGGFAADFAPDSLLNVHRPDLSHLPTTNGEHCTGDGIKMAKALGGQTYDIESVQVRDNGWPVLAVLAPEAA